jgi:hypothetical protein
MPQGILIPTNSDAAPRLRHFGRLEDYQQAVDGPIEAVALPRPLGLTILANEEGRLRQFWVPSLWQQTVLVGDVIVTGPPDERGDLTDAPAALVQDMLYRRGFTVELRLKREAEWRPMEPNANSFFEAVIIACAYRGHTLGVEEVRITPLSPCP